MKYDQIQKKECPICGREIKFNEVVGRVHYFKNNPVMAMTMDCHGIPYRSVCVDCYDDIMETKGYDGEYYTEADENIDRDY